VANLKAKEPVALQYVVAAVPIVAAFALQVLDSGGVSTPAWIRAFLTGLGGVIGALGALWARSQVISPATVTQSSVSFGEGAKPLFSMTEKAPSEPRELGAPHSSKLEIPGGSVDTGTGLAEVRSILEKHKP
jgi:hypothetical protein